MENITGILLGIFSSIIASIVFWLISFRVSRTCVQFSSVIAKSKNTGEYPGKNRYRVKLINSGTRDLVEITLLAKIAVKRGKTSNYTYIGIGNENRLPILRGKKYQYRNSGLSCAHILTLYPIVATLSEYRKNFYTEHIRAQAASEELCLDDIFNEYGNDVKLTIFVFGNDALTGARKMYSSKVYTIDDTAFGKYGKAKPLKSQPYKQYILDTLTFIMNTATKHDVDAEEFEFETSVDIESK